MSKKKYYITYTVLFLILFFLCFEIYFLIYHKSPLRNTDAFDQQYIAYIYLGKWIRRALTKFQFPVWDHAIGYGADIFLTFSGKITDPFYLLSALVPARFSEYGFLAMIVGKLYLTGIAFSFFGFHRKKEPYAILCGAIAYTFCACAYTGIYQTAFINPLYIFPFLICGTDDLFLKKKSALYVVSLAYCALSDFYFTYMSAIFIVIYCILKWIFLEKEKKASIGFGRVVFRFVVYSLWAVGMAAVTLIPVALLMLDMDRLDLQRYLPMFYDKAFYNNMYTGFLTTYDMQGRDCKIGFSVVVLICVFGLFLTGKKKYRQIKLEFLLMSVGLCIPFVGHVMNGFGYVANRWIWAYAFLLAYIVTLEIPRLREMCLSKWLILMGICCMYIFLGYAFFGAKGDPFFTMSVVLLVVCLLLCLLRWANRKNYERAVILISCISVLFPAFFQYSKKYLNYLDNFMPANLTYFRATSNGGLPLLNMIDTSDGTRYNRNGLSLTRNASMLYGTGGMDFYLGYYNNSIDQFHNSIALKTSPWNFGYNGLDGRSELLALLGVNHFFTKAGDENTPVTFDVKEAETTGRDGRIASWTSDKKHGLFSRFSEAISYEDYYTLSPYDRQQLMMKAVAVDSEYANTERDKISLSDGEIDYFIESVKNLEVNGNTIHVLNSDGTMILRFPEAVENGETYIWFENIHFENGTATTFNISVAGLDGKDIFEKTRNEFKGLNNIHHMYGGKHNWILNLGDVEDRVDGVTIEFQTAGWYTLDGIHLYSRPVSEIRGNIMQLNQDVEDIRLTPNKIELEVTAYGQEILLAAVPYSDGWKAYDNGKPAKIMNADVGFMALKLDEGSHGIRFVYHTPGFLTGLSVSVALILGYIVIMKKRRFS